MSTLYYSHADCLNHDTGVGHPESADRLRSIDKALQKQEFANLIRTSAPIGADILSAIEFVHPRSYIETILKAVPKQDYHFLDNDTVLSPGSGNAALSAVAAVCGAVDNICTGKATNAFCAVRPPGHHATPVQAMGFCLFNNIAITAAYACNKYAINRVAIVDFDVHHGNGTQTAVCTQPDTLYASSHEMPNFPGTGYASETGIGNIINVPLSSGTSGSEFRARYRSIILPAVKEFNPDLLLISAGFDAHKDDPLASILLQEDDYQWLTEELVAIAETCCKGRIISALEGGYHLQALANSVASHIGALMGSS